VDASRDRGAAERGVSPGADSRRLATGQPVLSPIDGARPWGGSLENRARCVNVIEAVRSAVSPQFWFSEIELGRFQRGGFSTPGRAKRFCRHDQPALPVDLVEMSGGATKHRMRATRETAHVAARIFSGVWKDMVTTAECRVVTAEIRRREVVEACCRGNSRRVAGMHPAWHCPEMPTRCGAGRNE